MDGGGFFARPLTAATPARASARAVPAGLALPGLRRRSVSVPIERRLPRFLGTGLTLGFFGTVALVGLIQGGHWPEFQERYGAPHHALGRLAGLGLERVTIAGTSQLTEAEILAAAGLTGKLSLAFLDAAGMREELEKLPLVKTAFVRKLYPHGLVVTVTERVPDAIWQHDGELFIIAADGTPIDVMETDRFANLPFVVGDGANKRTRDYIALLDAAGPLRSRIRAGTLVSGRRWTLKIDNGLDVRLPELGAAEALARLAKLDREQGILDKDVLAIDLRLPDRVIVRLTEEAAQGRAESMKKKPVRGKGVDT